MKEILCFGDSNTYGLIPGTTERYEDTVRWTGRLNQYVEKHGYRMIEEGLCGRTTVFDDPSRNGRNGSDILPMLIESHQPLDGVILMLGTNDCKSVYHKTAKQIAEGMEQLIRVIRAYSKTCKILIISPILLGDEVWKPQFDPDFDQKSVQVCRDLKTEYQLLAVRTGCDFLAAQDYASAGRQDMEHMEKVGHTDLADGIYYKLKEVYQWT